VMQRLVGIIRVADELTESLDELEKLKERARHMTVEGNRQYNPGWHLALDIRNMLLVSECVATAALERKESRGGHTRNDYPGPDPHWGSRNLVLTMDDGGGIALRHQDLPVMPEELQTLFEETS
jgi:succinate dehydrogenase flavoprotein subunit